jgi:hypothetical protein
VTRYFEVVDAECEALQPELSLPEVVAQQRISLSSLAPALGGVSCLWRTAWNVALCGKSS